MAEPVIVGRMRAGEVAAFDELAALYGKRLEATARRVVRCPEMAAEIVQDVFFRLWRDREALAVRDHLDGYLSRAVRNRALDRVKRFKLESRWLAREQVQVGLEERDRVGRLDGVDDPDGEWDRAVTVALERLPPKRRQAVLLRWRDGLSYAEIAARLDVSPKTIENQIGRALKTLRSALVLDRRAVA